MRSIVGIALTIALHINLDGTRRRAVLDTFAFLTLLGMVETSTFDLLPHLETHAVHPRLAFRQTVLCI